jgi:uncharacterized protein
VFEFDPVKSKLNKEKHGIDFVEAQALWRVESLIVFEANVDVEPRFAATGRIDELMWTAIGVMRGKSIRLISVRRARSDEVQLYESENEENLS